SADGMVLAYPHPPASRASVLPAEGPRWPLTRVENGGYTITDPQLGRTLHFPASRSGGDLPLVAISDRNGNRIDLVHDEAGMPVEIRHSGGYRIAVDSHQGRIRRLRLLTGGQDGQGEGLVLVCYGYDDAGHLAEVFNSSENPLLFSYDAEGRLIRWQDRNGFWYGYTYDSEGRGIRGTGSGGFLNASLSFEPEARRTVVTDSLGHPTTYRFNDAGQVIAQTDPLGRTTLREWDRFDRLLSRTDPLGRTSRYSYDSQGNLIAITRPDGHRSVADYNGLNLPVNVVEADGTTWRQEYDARGNLTAVTDPLGAITRYTYDGQGGLVTILDALGNTVRVRTDAAGLPVAVTDPMGSTTGYARDAFGRVSAVTDAMGGVIRVTWTVEGKMTSRVLPSGAVERWAYDDEGNLIEYTDAVGQITHTEYTHFDVPAAQTTPDGARLEFTHDTELRLLTVTNPQGLVWRYDYDAVGNLIQETDFNNRILTYAHDRAGQLVKRVNGAGEAVHYQRDLLGNVVEERDADRQTTFEYDLEGRLVHAVNPDADVRFDRDPLGRVVAEMCNGRTLTSTYDPLGRRVHRRTPTGAEAVWEYDGAGRPVALQTAGQSLRFGYDAAGREVQRHLGTGAVLDQGWDADHRLSSQTLWGASAAGLADQQRGPLQQRSYSYRADGNVLGIGDQMDGGRRLDLDLAGRVTAIHARGWVERYAYDSAGNLTHATWPAPSPEDGDALGPREYAGTEIRRAGNVRYEHDAQGRVVLRQHKTLSAKPRTWKYVWDTDDRLVAVTTPDGHRWRYRYDPLARRVAKELLAADGTVVEQVDFVWDGSVLAEQTHGVRQQNGRTTTWEYEPDSFRPLTQTERAPLRDASQQWIDQRFHAIVTDLVGTPTELVDPSGTISWHSRTTLWGSELPTPQNSADCPLRFPGQYHDAETGLSYNYYRYYSSATARYESADPIGMEGGTNPYTYVPSPFIWLDPLGLKCTRAEMAAMMRSQSIAPDLLDKGVHFNVGKIELRINPTADGGVVLKNVFASQANDRGLQAAIKKGYEALQYPEFRNWLEKHASAGMQMASQAVDKRYTGRGREFKALIKALGRM
ncbi:MAG: repeat-associated core domain protein, partial [Actinomycetia bacterium]|nr:repeat-associated core domain protein [Actinomycetes bacterium]